MSGTSGKGNVFSKDILALVLNATPIAGIASDATSGALDHLYLALHTSSPMGATEVGDATTHEATYGGYARIPVVRSNTNQQWTIGNGADGKGQAQNTNTINAATCTSGSNVITHVSLCTALSGAAKILYWGAPTSPVGLSVSTPNASFPPNNITILED